MDGELHIAPDRDALSRALARRVTAVAEEALAARGRFTLAIPGGSAVDLLAAGLQIISPAGPVDGSAWRLFWVDERCVPLSHPDSNFRLAHRTLLCHLTIPDAQCYGVDNPPHAAAAARTYAATLRAEATPHGAAWPVLDLILLGVGPDGHVASLFPNHPALEATDDWVVPVPDAPKPPPARITMTLPVINAARTVILTAHGPGKASIISALLDRSGTPSELPAGRVAPADGTLYWFLDAPAAAGIRDEAATSVKGTL